MIARFAELVRLSRVAAAANSADRQTAAGASLRDFHQRHAVHQAVGKQEVAIARDRRVAHDVAAAWDHPALEFLGLWIEAHDRIRRRLKFAIPDDILDY